MVFRYLSSYESSKSAEITGFLDSVQIAMVFPKLRQRFPKGRTMVAELLCGNRGEVRSEVIKRYIKRIEHD